VANAHPLACTVAGVAARIEDDAVQPQANAFKGAAQYAGRWQNRP
jgi:hypothetical protein